MACLYLYTYSSTLRAHTRLTPHSSHAPVDSSRSPQDDLSYRLHSQEDGCFDEVEKGEEETTHASSSTQKHQVLLY